jgi:CHAT domain-containing protein
MSLGAAGVLSTLWLVDDRATMLLIGKFYDLHMSQGLAPPAALQRAQSWLRTAGKAELIDYARAKTESGWMTPEQFSRLDTLFRTGDIRVRFGTLIGWMPKVGRAQSTNIGSCEPMRHEPPPPFAHPYFWGAFIHTGL